MKKIFSFIFVYSFGALILSGGVVFCLPSAQAQTTIFETGWENGQTLGLSDRVQYSKNVAGWFNNSSPPPECSRRYQEVVRSGSYSLMIAGYSKASYAYCYYRVFDQRINVVNGTKIGYWVYHAAGTAKVSVDGHFTNGNTIRDFGNGAIKDQYGVKIHPGARKDPMNQWYYVEVDLSPAAGKTLDYIMFAFDNGNDGFTGQYRAYVDDFKIFVADTPNPCQASVTADRWKGEYFSNTTLSGTPVMVRDDGNGSLGFDWGSGSPSSSCSVPVDNFSVRWTRSVYFSAGNYQFTVASDDGVRFYVDGVLKLDRWVDRAITTDQVMVSLTEGNHTLKMEYYEKGGLAAARLSWQIVSNPCLATVSADRWKGEYFNNTTLSGTPVMVRDDGNGSLGFDWGSGSPSSSCGVPTDNFSVRWTRTVHFDTGTYEFIARVDDGVKLWVGSQLVINGWIDQAPTTYRGTAQLSGDYSVKMEYYERGGGATASLSWQKVDNPLPTSDSKLTIHGGFEGPESMRFVREAQPATVKVLDRVDVAREIKQVSPNTKIVARLYFASQPMDGDPVQRANEWWNQAANKVLNNPEVDYWEGYNEPGNLNTTEMAWYARFEQRRVEILAQNGRKACIGNFSTGTPDVKKEIWEAFYPAIDAAMAHGGVLGLHEYSAPAMDTYFDSASGEGWHTGRYRKVYKQFLIPSGRQIPLVITECGIDGGVAPPCRSGGCGWKAYQSADNYFNQLKWYDGLLQQDAYVLGATIYCLELPNPEWDSFDIEGDVLNKLIDYVR